MLKKEKKKDADPISGRKEANQNMIVKDLLSCQCAYIQTCKPKAPHDLQTHCCNQIAAEYNIPFSQDFITFIDHK